MKQEKGDSPDRKSILILFSVNKPDSLNNYWVSKKNKPENEKNHDSEQACSRERYNPG